MGLLTLSWCGSVSLAVPISMSKSISANDVLNKTMHPRRVVGGNYYDGSSWQVSAGACHPCLASSSRVVCHWRWLDQKTRTKFVPGALFAATTVNDGDLEWMGRMFSYGVPKWAPPPSPKPLFRDAFRRRRFPLTSDGCCPPSCVQVWRRRPGSDPRPNRRTLLLQETPGLRRGRGGLDLHRRDPEPARVGLR